ncbi:hypothetical protein BDP27DRAFT_422947 [Rhodocollybia butyracea]|uniref:Uncharacterized protein n=1 Tax=Rhodocollybia butyracea TaxID=206335 RepID=A0A9P5PDW7_9AGAR|nr:hypothetical protein BDP27DRAFT_422947 [Rhodocollybia butyracea]
MPGQERSDVASIPRSLVPLVPLGTSTLTSQAPFPSSSIPIHPRLDTSPCSWASLHIVPPSRSSLLFSTNIAIFSLNPRKSKMTCSISAKFYSPCISSPSAYTPSPYTASRDRSRSMRDLTSPMEIHGGAPIPCSHPYPVVPLTSPAPNHTALDLRLVGHTPFKFLSPAQYSPVQLTQPPTGSPASTPQWLDTTSAGTPQQQSYAQIPRSCW